MRRLTAWLAALAAGTCTLAAQPPPALVLEPPPRPPVFPEQMRPPGDPALVERGSVLYATYCRACHGADLRGGDLGGPNLLRSPIVLSDAHGEAIGPVIREGRAPQGGGTAMPPLPMSDADVRATAEYIHDVARTMQPQGAPPRNDQRLELLVGNAAAGRRYFAQACASCHSATGDLAGIAARIDDIERLQVSWVSGRPGGLRSGWAAPGVVGGAQRRVTLQFADGTRAEGVVARLDDFHVSFTTDEGEYRSHSRRGLSPRIVSLEVHDPLAGHRALWLRLSDKDMHDVTAYLATLK